MFGKSTIEELTTIALKNLDGKQKKLQEVDELLGKIVRIEEAGSLVRVGEVEAVMPSGDLMWIKASGCETRALFGRALGQLVYPLNDPNGMA
jgi:ribosomal protein S1